MNEFKKYIISTMEKKGYNIDSRLIETPPDPRLGDFAFPCFSLSHEKGKSPAEIAKQLVEELELESPIESIENKGPYLNFFINPKCIAKKVIGEENLEEEKEQQKIMIEFSSPNTNKPLHLGHLRNIFLGDTLSRIFEKKGNKIIKACLVNDRGVHICKSMLMYMKNANGQMPDKKPDHFVGDFYVMFDKEVKDNPKLEQEAQELLRKWEYGDEEANSIWRMMTNWANEGFQQTYDKLNIEFDKYYYESNIYKNGKDLVKEGLREGLFYEDEGAISVDLGKLGKKVLLRKDDTSVYITQDLYLAKLKFDEYSLDKSIYVVASEQNLHFQQLFKILEIMDFHFADKCFHLSYGMVSLPEGKMKSREGTVVDADDLIDEVHSLAREEVKKRHELAEGEIRRRSEIIGNGALRFHLLRTDPSKDMTYDPKKSISFEGETGPYIQYVYARISSILKKNDDEISSDCNYDVLNDNEVKIIKKLSSFLDTINEAKTTMKPNYICRYLLDLCQLFNEYYHTTNILKAEKEKKNLRLLLLERIRQTIKEGLELLHIETLEEM